MGHGASVWINKQSSFAYSYDYKEFDKTFEIFELRFPSDSLCVTGAELEIAATRSLMMDGIVRARAAGGGKLEYIQIVLVSGFRNAVMIALISSLREFQV